MTYDWDVTALAKDNSLAHEELTRVYTQLGNEIQKRLLLRAYLHREGMAYDIIDKIEEGKA
jgi:hypothetical protein